MLEDLEELSEITRNSENEHHALSSAQTEYINECVGENNPRALVDRIDELSPYQPPKGIDCDASIAELIEPVKDQINSKYLEAPNDIEQIQQISEYMSGHEELKYENWELLSPNERLNILQNAEYQIANIEHREPCPILVKELPENEFGFYSPYTRTITVNERYLNDSDFNSYKETLDTLIHEGRHAYQDYNLTEREVHPRSGEVNNWKWNENEIGYQNADKFGFEAYAMQPVEADARAFADDVLKAYFNKTA